MKGKKADPWRRGCSELRRSMSQNGIALDALARRRIELAAAAELQLTCAQEVTAFSFRKPAFRR
jgi:hypothetical protein